PAEASRRAWRQVVVALALLVVAVGVAFALMQGAARLLRRPPPRPPDPAPTDPQAGESREAEIIVQSVGKQFAHMRQGIEPVLAEFVLCTSVGTQLTRMREEGETVREGLLLVNSTGMKFTRVPAWALTNTPGRPPQAALPLLR